MVVSERQYLKLFQNRGSGEAEHEAWLQASMDTLDAYFKNTDNQTDKAASIISETWGFEGRRALAYSAYCFWHRPVLEIAQKHSSSLSNVKENWNSWRANGILEKIYTAESSPETEAVLQKTERSLNLATTAFKSITHDESGYKEFQRDMVAGVLEELAADPMLKETAQNWPRLQDETGMFLEEVVTDKGALSASAVDQIQKMNPTEIAERASKVMSSVAQKLRPDIYQDMPEIEACLFDPRVKGGTYFYDGKSARYGFDEHNANTFASLPRLLSGFLHETEHLLQQHLTHKLESLEPKDPLKNAALIFRDEFQGQNKAPLEEGLEKAKVTVQDIPISLYSLKNHEPCMNAYMARPTEAFAYKAQGVYYDKLTEAYKGGVTPNLLTRTNNSLKGVFVPPKLSL